MLQDETAVASMVNVISNVFANPFECEELICLSTGLQETKEVEADFIPAKEKEQKL